MNNYYKLARKHTLEEINRFLVADEKGHLNFVAYELNLTELMFYAYLGLESELKKIDE